MTESLISLFWKRDLSTPALSSLTECSLENAAMRDMSTLSCNARHDHTLTEVEELAGEVVHVCTQLLHEGRLLLRVLHILHDVVHPALDQTTGGQENHVNNTIRNNTRPVGTHDT